MAGGYSILNALNKSTRQQAEDRPGARFRTRDISITDIYPNGNNFYSMQDVEALAEDIKAVGLLENLTVVYDPKNGRNYKLLGGERRWRALMLLVDAGYNEFSVATCQIRTAENERAELIEIIMCNRQRVKTVWEQVEEERRLKQALQEMKQNGETLKGYNLQEGRLRDTIAAILNYSAAKVGQMETITNSLRREFKDALKDERINFSTAYTLAKMTPEEQERALQAYEETGELNSRQAKEAAAPEEYGSGQMNVESICYSCAHWEECYQKSATTVKCATYEDKNRKQQEEPEEKGQETPQARVLDTETGEVYKNMAEAEKAAEQAQEGQETHEESRDGEQETAGRRKIHYVRIASADYAITAAGVKTFELRKNDRDYKTGDILEMNEFKDGRNTGRTIRADITYMLEDYTGLTEGYCILGIKVTEVNGI